MKRLTFLHVHIILYMKIWQFSGEDPDGKYFYIASHTLYNSAIVGRKYL